MVIKILGLRLENKKGQQNLLTFFIELKSESTDKPGSVVDNHSSGTNVTACLKQPTRSQRGSRHLETYLVLLRVGFTLPLLLPTARCALTAPFHPYLYSRTNHRRSALCGTFRRLPPPRRYLALYPLEPGLSSGLPPFKRMRISENSEQRLPSQLMREFTTQSGTIRLNI